MKKISVEEVLLPVPYSKIKQREKNVREEFWSKFTSFAINLPFAEEVAAGFFCATDNNTPLKVRGTLLAALAYFILPLDLIPDILAIVGFTDDIAVLTAALAMVSKHITDEHRIKARAVIESPNGSDPDRS